MTAAIRQYDFGFAPRTTLKIGFVEELIKERRLIVPCPARNTLIELIDEGVIEGYLNHDLSCYVVFEDSFLAWLRSRTVSAPITIAA